MAYTHRIGLAAGCISDTVFLPDEETMNDQCDRRGFAKIWAAAGAAWVMGSECLAEGASDGKVQPMEDVRVGMVGIGNRGTFLVLKQAKA